MSNKVYLKLDDGTFANAHMVLRWYNEFVCDNGRNGDDVEIMLDAIEHYTGYKIDAEDAAAFIGIIYERQHQYDGHPWYQDPEW